MKIVILSDYFQAEIGYAKFKIAQALQDIGHSVTVVASERYFPFHNYSKTMEPLLGKRIKTPGKFVENGIKVLRLPIYFEAFTRAFCKEIPEVLDYLQPDLVIVYGISSFSAYQAARSKDTLRYKLVVADSHLPSEFEHGNQLMKSLLYGGFRTFFSNTVASKADKVVALQPKTCEVISNIYGIKKNCTVIENGTDCKLYRYSKELRTKVRKELKIPTNAQVLIYTGKVIPEKGVHLLLKAFSSLAKDNSSLYCLVIGNSTKEYKSSCLSELNQDKKRVLFIDAVKQDKLAAYYSASDLAVWPLQESLAMNDAAACSLPFVASESLKDSLRLSNNNGKTYKTGSTTSLTKTIKSLLNNPAELKKMGKRGRKVAENKLSWEGLAQEYLL